MIFFQSADAGWYGYIKYVYHRLLVVVQHADLLQLAANIQSKQSKNMVFFMGCGWV